MMWERLLVEAHNSCPSQADSEGVRTPSPEKSKKRSGARSAMSAPSLSYLERGPLMWMMPLHVNQKPDDDDEEEEDQTFYSEMTKNL